MIEETGEKKSKYNSGMAQIKRLDELWRKSHSCVFNEQYYQWNTVLDRVWCELAKDLEQKDSFPEKEKEFKKINSEIGVIKDTSNTGFQRPSKDDMAERGKQYESLMKKEIFLRRLENQLGKGTAYKDDSEDDFD